MKRFVVLPALLLTTVFAAYAQYKMEPVPTPPPDLPAAYTAAFQKSGYRVAGDAGPFCDIWFRTALPTGPKSAEEAVSFPTIPQGALLGVIYFPAKGADRRGQTMKPGLYTLRYSLYPINGDHQGVAPQRDFAVLSRIADDPDPSSTPAFDPLVEMSRKASGTPHPAVLSIETPPAGAAPPSLNREGDKDWTLSIKVGDTPVAVIVIGKSDA